VAFFLRILLGLPVTICGLFAASPAMSAGVYTGAQGETSTRALSRSATGISPSLRIEQSNSLMVLTNTGAWK